MPVLTVLGAKGGVGASIVATNLGAALADSGRCVVIDLHLACPADDLLLNLRPRGTWLDLLPVADQLTARHLELTVAGHDTGPGLLGAPTQIGLPVPLDAIVGLLGGLDRVFSWVVADVAPGAEPLSLAAAEASHRTALVVTADPPALRGAQRVLASLSPAARSRTGVVLNQFTHDHPVPPDELGVALDCSIFAVLPRDAAAVAKQVHFGRPIVLAEGSPLRSAMRDMVRRLTDAAVPGVPQRGVPRGSRVGPS